MHSSKLIFGTATTAILLLFSCFVCLTNAQQCQLSSPPKAIYSNTRLPNPEYGMSVIYDGQDSILIFNGRPDDRALYQFNISTEEITKLVNLPVMGEYAPVVRIQDGSYLYFGNGRPQRVFRYDPSDNSSSIVADFYNYDEDNLEIRYTLRSFFTSSDPNMIHLVSNYGSGSTSLAILYDFDTTSFCANYLRNVSGTNADLPVATFGPYAYIFSNTASLSKVTQINRETKEVAAIGTTNVIFPNNLYGTTVTSTKFIYMFGGYANGQPFPSDGILQYRPADNKFRFIRIDEMPTIWGQSLGRRPPSIVFVEKLNRIYFLGGEEASGSVEFDHIWYIDVSLIE